MDYIREMLQLQDGFNEKTVPNWREKNLDWVNAIMLEASEQNESLHSWKWWKNTNEKDDLANFEVEVIDNWHFLMSLGMTVYSKSYLNDEYKLLWEETLYGNEINSLQEETQLFCYYTLGSKFSKFRSNYFKAVKSLFNIMITLEIDSFEELYKKYLIKNCLNGFRQDNGYKDGTYIKIWTGADGKKYEDNVIAWELTLPNDTIESLYFKLDLFYKNM